MTQDTCLHSEQYLKKCMINCSLLDLVLNTVDVNGRRIAIVRTGYSKGMPGVNGAVDEHNAAHV